MRLDEFEKLSSNYVDVKELNKKTLDAIEQCGIIKSRLQAKLKIIQENVDKRK